MLFNYKSNKGNDMSNTTYSFKKPTKSEIKDVLEHGVIAQQSLDKITTTIKADIFHRNEKNQTKLTETFNNIMESEDAQLKIDVKRFIRKQLQTIIKAKASQEQLLNGKEKTHSITVKKVNNSMIDNVDGIYKGNFNESDYGRYVVVIQEKPKAKEKTLEECLQELMKKHEADKNQVLEALNKIC